jgi:beta-glucosidase
VDNGSLRIEALPPGERGRIVSWSGTGTGEVTIRSDVPIDLTREMNGNLALAMNVRIGAPPVSTVSLGMDGGALDITPLLRNVRPGEWTEVRIRLRCFAEAGADMRTISTPLRMRTDGALSLGFNDVRILPATEGEATPCPTALELR